MKIRAIIFSTAVLCSCEKIDRATFDVPQPEEKQDIKSIPKKLMGTYQCLTDSSLLEITKDQIISRSGFYTDTLLSISKGEILRNFKGYYFLNEFGRNGWKVTKLGKTRDGLILGTISTKEDLQNLRELTGLPSDTIYNKPTRFRPTRKELKQFLKEKGFQSEKKFIKVKYPLSSGCTIVLKGTQYYFPVASCTSTDSVQRMRVNHWTARIDLTKEINSNLGSMYLVVFDETFAIREYHAYMQDRDLSITGKSWTFRGLAYKSMSDDTTGVSVSGTCTCSNP